MGNTKHKILHCALLTLILIEATSCRLGPQYERPMMEIPYDWRFEADNTPTDCNLLWWQQLNDPVLNALIDEALESNKDLKIAIARVQEYREKLIIVNSALYPEIDANGSYSRQELSANANQILPGQARTFNLYSAMLSLSYELDIWGKIRSASDAALAQLLAQVEARRAVVLSLVSDVAEAYVTLRQYDMQLEIANKTIKSREESLKLAKLRYEGGLTSEMEVMQADSELQDARTQGLQFQILVPQQEDALSVLVGHPPQAIRRGLTLEQMTLPAAVPTGLPSDLLQQRPDVMKAEKELMAANSEIGVAIAQMFPEINLTAYYGNESIHLHDLFTASSRTWQYGLSVFQPLFTAGRLMAQVREAKDVTYEAMYNYEQVVLNAFAEVNDALIAHQITQNILVVQKEKVRALAEYLHLATLRYDNGQTDYLTVLDAERQLFRAQLDEAQVQSNVFLSLINLYQALGGGWVLDADCHALHNYMPPPLSFTNGWNCFY